MVATSKTVPFAKRKTNKEVFGHCAVIDYVNEKGEKVRFVTQELNENPKEISKKDVTVYVYSNKEYATDFGTIYKYTDRRNY